MDPFCPSSPGGDPLSIGDYIYLQPTDTDLDPYIARIEALNRDSNGKELLYVRWFYRLADVQHPLPSSSLGKESVFYTSYFDSQAADHVYGHCKVVTKAEYDRLQGRIPGMDVYACEYSYSAESLLGFCPIKDEYIDLSPGSSEKTALSAGRGTAPSCVAEVQLEELRDHVWKSHSPQFGSAKRAGLSCGQENVDPQGNDDILEIFAQKASRVSGTTDIDAVNVALLRSNMDLIARHAVSDAERIEGEGLEGEITWGTRRRARLRESNSSETGIMFKGLLASNSRLELQEAASNPKKLRKAARLDKSTKSQVQKPRPDSSPSPVTGPTSSLATSVTAVTKDQKARRTQSRISAGVLKLPKEMQGRWSSERYKSAQLKLIDIMHQRGAVPGRPILRNALRDEARKHIGDTGLLDHLLKHMTDSVVNSGERFRRRHNPEGAMEYWLEDAALVEIRKAAGIDDPWWMPPPGWKPGDRVPARGEYVYCQGMSPAEAVEMKRLQDMVCKMRSEMKSLSVQVKDLSSQVSAAQNDNSDSGRRMDNIEIDFQKHIKDTFEKMEIEMRNIRREIETIQDESLKYQSAIQHKSNVAGPTRSSGELDQVDDTDAHRSRRLDSQGQLQLKKFESQFQSVSEEWRRKFHQVGADKVDIEVQLSTMCKVVNRIQEDMHSIMRALGFSEQNLTSAQISAIAQVAATDGSVFPTSCNQVAMGTHTGSTKSMIEGPGETEGATGMLLERLQVQNLVLQMSSSNPQEDAQFRATERPPVKHQPGVDLSTPARSSGWNTSNMPMTGALRMENIILPQLLPAVGSNLQMTSQSAESNIHMLLRLPPKKYISSIFQHHVNLQEVIPHGMACNQIQTPSIYGGRVESHVSPSLARPTLSDYQHQHQEDNRTNHVRITEETPVLINPALSAASENIGSVDFRCDRHTTNKPMYHSFIGSQQDRYPGLCSPTCALDRSSGRTLHLKDSQICSGVQACPGQNVQAGEGIQNFRNKEGGPSAKRKFSSSTVVAPLAKRKAISRMAAVSGRRCTSLQHNELSTQLSLSVTTAQANLSAVSDIAASPLASQLSSLGSMEPSALYEEGSPTVRSGTQTGADVSDTVDVQLECSWLGLATPPRSRD